MKRIFLSLWHGDTDLWKTFWLFGVIALIVIPQVIAIPAGVVGGLWHIPDGWFLLLSLPLVILNVAYAIFVAIAVRKSAKKHQGHRMWAYLAQATMTALVIIIIYFNAQAYFKEIKSVANQGPVRLP